MQTLTQFGETPVKCSLLQCDALYGTTSVGVELEKNGTKTVFFLDALQAGKLLEGLLKNLNPSSDEHMNQQARESLNQYRNSTDSIWGVR